jgi:hypothetical protein
LDGYGREDLLGDLYGYDNSDFTGFLKARGFFVAQESVTNYSLTTLSLSSSLNMEYVNNLTSTKGEYSDNRNLLIDLIHNSKVRILLEAEGYQLVNIESGNIYTEIEDAYLYFESDENSDLSKSKTRSANTFEWLLLETTAFQGVFDFLIVSHFQDDQDQGLEDSGYQEHRSRILNAIEYLDYVVDQPGQYFVFVHMIIPHPPFVFAADGTKVYQTGFYNTLDGDEYRSGQGNFQDNYIQGYIGQVQFINSKLKSVIDSILRNSYVQPIIIIQGDHGPRAYLDGDSSGNSNLSETFSILNAYYFPDRNYSNLYPSISPVNSFRAVFNTYFKGSFRLFEDRSYYSSSHHPYKFIEVTDRLESQYEKGE